MSQNSPEFSIWKIRIRKFSLLFILQKITRNLAWLYAQSEYVVDRCFQFMGGGSTHDRWSSC